MSRARSRARTRRCGEPEAAKRLRDARKYLEVAELVAEEDSMESVSVSAGLAVLAGIAASDAACCKALGQSSRGQDHRDATGLLRQVEPGGEQAAKDFERLVAMKDAAHYGFTGVAAGDLKGALRRAADLVSFAESTLER